MLPWNVEDLTFDETRFNGKVRLFPLPDLVMFPHVMQPLHIFEPRYRELLNDALDSDGLIAMGVLSPGWENDFEGCPPVEPYACLGKIVTHQRTEEGHYNILLLGVRRILIDRELPSDRSFREAEVTLLDDYVTTENDDFRNDLQATLTKRFQETLPVGSSVESALEEILASEIPLSVLTDLVSFAVPMEYATKQVILAECDVDIRALMLLDALDGGSPSPRPSSSRFRNFGLPPFSAN
jgi:Lon protease-like protein